MKIFSIPTSLEKEIKGLERGHICKFLAKDFDIRTQKNYYVFEIIGEPVSPVADVEVRFK